MLLSGLLPGKIAGKISVGGGSVSKNNKPFFSPSLVGKARLQFDRHL
jgi:hypothetical protein